MIRMLIRVGISLATSAIGLWIASLIVDGVTLSVSGFLIAIVVFTVAQAILTPFVVNIARKYASALLGGVGLVSTYISLLIASLFPEGLRISGISQWVLATLVVWIITALGTWLLPLVFLKKRVSQD